VTEKPSEIKTEEEKVKIVEKKPIEKNKFADKAREEKASSVKTSHDAPKRLEPKKEAETESKESEESGVFRLNPTKFESNIKVTGKIDLSAINQSTRPKKKTERRT